jgi:sarcosine oxidase subunit beta
MMLDAHSRGQRRIIVIGGGVNGLSIGTALAVRGGGEVLVLERDTVASGMTGKSSSIVRCHYGVPSLAAMAWRSLPVFEELGESVGFHRVGYLVAVGETNVEPLRANAERMQHLGVEVEMISVDEAARLWPYMSTDDLAAAAYEPGGGYADASQLAMWFHGAARDAGAVVRQGSRVARLLTTEDRVVGVELTTGEVISADVVVVAAAWWSVGLLETAGVGLPIQSLRNVMMLVDTGRPGSDLQHLPVLSDLEERQYIRNEVGGRVLVGNSDHSRPTYAGPDDYSNQWTEFELERGVGKAGRRLSGFPQASVFRTYAGCYDVTPDWNPVIGGTPVENLFVAAGFSGHGFKISPAVGQLIADLVLEGDSRDPEVPAHDFRLSRFADGDLLTSRHPYVGAGQMR